MEAGFSNDAVLAGGYDNVSRRSVERMRHSFNRYGLVYVPVESPAGRHCILNDLHIAQLHKYLDQRPSAYLDEMVYFLSDEFDIQVSLPTVWRVLQRSGWSRKVQRRIAAQREVLLRNHWLLSVLPKYRAEQLVFLDESAACERTADRKYGWAPLGETPGVISVLKRSKRWSILPALTVDGYLDWTIVQGSITKASYIQFIRDRVLPHCSPTASGLARSVLVMDNASIHKSPDLIDACRAAGVDIEYLPPYSPDFNPIETSFALLKAHLRRHTEDAQHAAISGQFGEFLNTAISAMFSSYDARKLYHKSRIRSMGNGYCWGEVNDSENDDMGG